MMQHADLAGRQLLQNIIFLSDSSTSEVMYRLFGFQ